MPAYNAEKYIGEAIESILNQTFKDFEFIIVDDCSTDKTWEIIQKYDKIDNRIVALRNGKNLGIPANRNKLVSVAKGKYIAWQDSDDISLPYRIEKQYNFMEKNIEVGICGGWLQFFNKNGNQSIRKYVPDDKNLRKNILRYSPVSQPAVMIRKKCLDECGAYDLRYPSAEDLDMSFRIGIKYKFANLQETVIRYRENNNSATFQKLKEMELKTLAIRKKAVEEYGYKMSLVDKIYWILQYISVFIIPLKMKIWLFNKLRNN